MKEDEHDKKLFKRLMLWPLRPMKLILPNLVDGRKSRHSGKEALQGLAFKVRLWWKKTE
jgi:hypothetical protein